MAKAFLVSHPWLMPDYWQVPTVSMGLSPSQTDLRERYLSHLAVRAHPRRRFAVWGLMRRFEMTERAM